MNTTLDINDVEVEKVQVGDDGALTYGGRPLVVTMDGVVSKVVRFLYGQYVPMESDSMNVNENHVKAKVTIAIDPGMRAKLEKLAKLAAGNTNAKSPLSDFGLSAVLHFNAVDKAGRRVMKDMGKECLRWFTRSTFYRLVGNERVAITEPLASIAEGLQGRVWLRFDPVTTFNGRSAVNIVLQQVVAMEEVVMVHDAPCDDLPAKRPRYDSDQE